VQLAQVRIAQLVTRFGTHVLIGQSPSASVVRAEMLSGSLGTAGWLQLNKSIDNMSIVDVYSSA
jgi:hypothetical protein